LTGFKFILLDGDEIVNTSITDMRIDHNVFENRAGVRTSIQIVTASPKPHPSGVIDHNTFINGRILVYGDLNGGSQFWGEPSKVGKGDGVVYVEDNNFSDTNIGNVNVIDANAGGRYVFRNNTVVDSIVEAHSLQGNGRATRSWEIYNNTFTTTRDRFAAIFVRGGSGVVFNNTINGPYSIPIAIDNIRSYSHDYGHGCDGTDSRDGNQIRGWPCRDQIGRSTDAGSIPAPQSSEPAHFWNNSLNGSQTTPAILNCVNTVKSGGSCADIVSGRDFILSPRPGYVPYTYPHPLTSGASAASIVPNDTNPPSPGNSGLIASSVTSNNAILNWARATDDQSQQGALQYEVRLSTNPDIDTAAKSELYGAVVKNYTTDITTATVAGLAPGTTYYFNVLVKDESGNRSSYVMKSVTAPATAPAVSTTDTTAPVPGGGGTMASQTVTSGGATLVWTKASDDLSPTTQLVYEVVRSSSNNVDTVLRAEAYGEIVQGYIPDKSSATFNGLNPDTTYYFNVLVKDVAGNRAIYQTKSIRTAAADATAPVPGNSGQMTSGNVGAGSVTVNWTKATDNTSSPSQLLYEVRRSLANNIDTVASAESNGLVAQNYLADISSATINGLLPGTNYFFTVIVKDAAGNKAVYSVLSVTTTGDTTPPVPGNTGLMTSNSNSSSITLNWTKGTDNVSKQAALRYEVRISNSNNLGTVARAELNGTIVKPYTADIGTVSITGLSSGTEYFVNVILKDEANNKAIYSTRSESTTGRRMTQLNNGKGPQKDDIVPTMSFTPSDATAPVPGLGGQIAISGISSTGLTLRWTSATDETSPKTALQYMVLGSATKSLNTVAEAESTGSVLLAFTADINSFVVKNLPNAIQHFFTVIVRDEAGNKAVYATAGNLGETYTYLANGGVALSTASAATSPLTVTQLQVTPAQGTVAPAGLALVRATGSRGVMSTAGISLSGGLRNGSVYADLAAPTEASEAVRSGVAFANPTLQNSEISFFFTDANGVEIKSGTYTLLANRQISGFLDESPFNGPAAFKGTFTFSASSPISATGTRSVTQRSGENLLESFPVVSGDPSATSALIPTFADGGGWSTEVVLTNPTSALLAGKVQFFGQGAPGVSAPVLEMNVNGVSATNFTYSIPPRAVVRLATSGAGLEARAGSVRITPSATPSAGGVPNAVAILTYRKNGMIVSESSIAAQPTGTAFRAFVERANSPDWVSSSVAIANTSDYANTINLQLTRLDGTPVHSTSVTLPPNGQISQFVADLFPGLESGFRGLLRLTSSAPVGLTVLRCMANSSGDFLFASTPAHNESIALPLTGIAFPLIATGAGYDTQVILFGQSGQGGTGEMMFLSRDGAPVIASELGVSAQN
jgi:phosphodiesterase/alkaline phosphatase D-like protein